jgi:hypothetical protein
MNMTGLGFPNVLVEGLRVVLVKCHDRLGVSSHIIVVTDCSHAMTQVEKDVLLELEKILQTCNQLYVSP